MSGTRRTFGRTTVSRSAISALLFFSLFWAFPVEAGVVPGTPPCGAWSFEHDQAPRAPSFSPETDGSPGLNIVLNPIKRYWMPENGPDGDHMTSVKGRSESLPPHSVDQGSLFYIAASPISDTQELFRLHSGEPDLDHMISFTPGEGGYLTEGNLGYSFTSRFDGMEPIYRWFSQDPFDHLAGFHNETPQGYAEEAAYGYGYPRFGENDGWQSDHVPVLREISRNGITLKSDISWGGAIYELWWGGVQFVNHFDSGREIQTALFKPGLGDVAFGPTEAGDMWRNGSPLIDMIVTARDLYTHSLPLQWGPQSYGGGENNPVLYGGEFERHARIIDHPRYNIIRYTVGYKPLESTEYTREWVTAYLNLPVSKKFYLYTPGGGFEEIDMPAHGENTSEFISEGAVIASSRDHDHALAFYTTEEAWVSWWNFEDMGGGGNATRKINIWDTPAWMNAGSWHHRTMYIIVGSLDQVAGAARFISGGGINL